MQTGCVRVAAVALAVSMFACGGAVHGPTPPEPTPTPDPCGVAPVLWQAIGWEGGTGGLGVGVRTLTRGVIRVTADWDNPAKNVDIYLTNAYCFPDPLGSAKPPCQTIYASADGLTTKPEVLQACLDAGEYWIVRVDRGLGRSKGQLRIEAPAGTPHPQ